MNEPAWLIAIVLAYLCGSVPYALLIGWAKGVDLREHGSGNVGATNCGRVLGKKYGILCFLLDLLKGLVPVLAAGWWFGLLGRSEPGAAEAGWWLGAAAAAVMGHIAPVWLRFRGGKGVATGFGAIAGVWPFLTLPAVAAMLTWLLFASTFRYVSLASLAAAFALPFYFLIAAATVGWTIHDTWPFPAAAAAIALLILLRHRGNVVRLWDGTEPRLGE